MTRCCFVVLLGFALAMPGLNAAESECKSAFVSCQQSTGNPLECRQAYADCMGGSPATKKPDAHDDGGCAELIEYRNNSLLKLLENSWPRQSLSLGISEVAIERLEEDLKAVEKTKDDLEWWSLMARISVRASSVMASFKRIPIIGEAIRDGECAANFHSLANSQDSDFTDTASSCAFRVQECVKTAAGDPGAFETAFFATGCVMKLAGNRVGRTAKGLYDVVAGTHGISSELIALRRDQKASKARVNQARAELQRQRVVLQNAIDDYQNVFRRSETIDAVNKTRAAIDQFCSAN